MHVSLLADTILFEAHTTQLSLLKETALKGFTTSGTATWLDVRITFDVMAHTEPFERVTGDPRKPSDELPVDAITLLLKLHILTPERTIGLKKK